MSRYAANTSVSSDQSVTEIQKIIRRYGADGFVYGWDGDMARVLFRLSGKQIRFELKLPSRADFNTTETGRRRRSSAAAESAWEQAGRQRWRALALVIKAKLEAVESEITTVEQEFLAHIVMPDGQTVGDHILPRVETAYLNGKMPTLLLTAGGKS